MTLATDQHQSFLRNIWYYALPGEQLKPGKMFAKQLLGEPIVFGRTHHNEVFALRDICPHRAVPLSCGRFNGEEIECAYHGWRFDEVGQCQLIPALHQGQELDLSKFRVRRYPVQEVQGNIWIYMSDQECGDTDVTHQVPVVPGFEDATYQAVLTMKFPCFGGERMRSSPMKSKPSILLPMASPCAVTAWNGKLSSIS
jgi:phenylpropionate dioxygenase-like ring-hydroxylating dioxygenase large terminal subunit